MRIEAIPEWALGAREDAVAGLVARCFDVDFEGRSFFKQRHHLRLLAWDGPVLIGHVALLWRAARLGGRPLDVAGLAEVATDPGRRGEGIARTLVARAVEEASASQAEALLLFGTAGLYAGLGFAPAANPMTYVAMGPQGTGAVRREPAESLMALPLGERPWDGAAPLDLMGPLF